MTTKRTVPDIDSWFGARVEELALREWNAWHEYLHAVRTTSADLYEQTEPLAWRRLRRTLATLAHDRRRHEFERDRAIAEAAGLRLVS